MMLQPSGTPRVKERCDAVEVVVTVCPPVSVMTSVATVGEGVRVGIALAFRCFDSRSATYVLVARPVLTILPGVAEMEALNVYEGVLYVGVESREFGRVVTTVADTDARKAETDAGDSSIVVALESG